MKQIVVARYKEDVSWTKQFNNVLIYNKGDALEGYDNVIPLQNVGREGHTYYTHIYNNYHNLADYNIFLQAYPFDHSPNIISDLHKYLNEENLHVNFKYLSVLRSGGVDCINPGPKFADMPTKEVYEALFGPLTTNFVRWTFGAGAQFIVSKNQILKRPKEFYLKIIKLLDYSVCPMEGYAMERFHPRVFNQHI